MKVFSVQSFYNSDKIHEGLPQLGLHAYLAVKHNHMPQLLTRMIEFILGARKSFVIARFREVTTVYPAVFAAISLCAGLLVSKFIEASARWPFAVLIPMFLLLLWGFKRKDRVFLLWSAVMLFLFLGWHLGSRELIWGKDFQAPVSKCVVHATVSKTLGTGSNFRVLLIDDGYNHTDVKSLPGKGRLILRDNTVPLTAGDRIAFRTRIRKPTNRGNPGEYDWETDCKHNSILWTASVLGPDSVVVLKRGSGLDPRAVLFRTRQAMSNFLDDHSGRYLNHFVGKESVSDVRAILKGLVLGDLGEITPSVYKNFVDSGLVHALSASGVHVAIVVVFVLAMVKVITWSAPGILLWLPFKKVGALAAIPATIMYCLLVGSRVPAIRSTIMAVVVCAAILMDRKWHSPNSLAIAAIAILLLYPLSFFTISFQLSFAAVAGIFLLVPPMYKHIYGRSPEKVKESTEQSGKTKVQDFRNKVLRSLTLVALTSLGATLAVTPFLFHTFHSFPVYTILANLLTDAMMTGALGLGLLASIIGLFWTGLAALILAPADFLTHMIVKVAQVFANLPLSTIRISHMGTTGFVLLCVCVVCILWTMQKPSRHTVFILCLNVACMAGTLVCYSLFFKGDADFKVTFLNVGKADASFIQPPGSKGVLIDGGLANMYFDSGRSILVPFLQWSGTCRLDGIIMTHPEMDHMGGLLAVMSQVPSMTFWWNPVGVRSAHLDKIMAAAAASRTAIRAADRNCRPVKFGSATLRFLNPTPSAETGGQPHRSLNNHSVVCKFECGAKSFLFMGDLEREGEDELLATGIPLVASVLKIGHHGGKNATSMRFLEAVRPEVAVITTEYPRTRGSPSQEVMDRLESAGVRVYWTGRDGAIIMNTNGSNLSIKTGRNPNHVENMSLNRPGA